MGAEAILDKIRQNGAEEASTLRKQGDERAKAAADQIRADGEKEAEFLIENARRTVAEMEKREALMAGLEVRKNTLAARRSVMDEAFQLAHKQLSSLPDDQWEALISRLVLKAAESGTEVLEIPAKDREKYEAVPEGTLPILGEKSFLKRLNAALKESGREGKLTLSDAVDISDGFRLVGPVFDVNASFDTLLSLVREEAEQEIYHILYPQNQ